MKLLREYARQNSEAAFAELVCRHINLVYSAALRHVGIAAQAEEITQAVFVILARKSASLREDQILDAWLFETTRLTALSFLRGERRRQFREQEAYMQSILQESTPDPVWQQLAPLLDDAMMRLGRRDREAVVLRFFKGRSLGEVAAALNIKEPAAQKRVSRALEKLRNHFARRGVDSTAAVIGETISANSIQAAPVALAKTVTAVALAKGAAASISTLTLIKGALKIMAWTKAKTAIVVGAGILITAMTTTVSVKEYQFHRKYPWEVPRADFNVLYDSPPTVKIVPTKFAKDGGMCSDSSRGAMGIAQPLKDIIQVAYQHDSVHTVVMTDLPTNRYDFMAKLVGPAKPHQNPPQNGNWTVELQKKSPNSSDSKAASKSKRQPFWFCSQAALARAVSQSAT